MGNRPQRNPPPRDRYCCRRAGHEDGSKHEGKNMLRWAAIFLVIAIIAALLGFWGIAGAAAGIAKFLFFLFIALFLILLLMGLFAGKRMP